MTQDEILAMFTQVWFWKQTVTPPNGGPKSVDTRLIQGTGTTANFPPNIIEARPGYLHFIAANGNDVVLEKI
jgi:hypothetical protein